MIKRIAVLGLIALLACLPCMVYGLDFASWVTFAVGVALLWLAALLRLLKMLVKG